MPCQICVEFKGMYRGHIKSFGVYALGGGARIAESPSSSLK